MGRRGPAPTPSAVKMARGETRPSRLNHQQPLPLDRRPVMPTGMSERAQTIWRRVMRDMAHTGAILAADTDTLRIYCETVDMYEQSLDILKKTGLVVRGARGNELVRNPVYQTYRDSRDAERLFARELGLSPAARAGMQVASGQGGGTDIDEEIGPPARLRVVNGPELDD